METNPQVSFEELKEHSRRKSRELSRKAQAVAGAQVVELSFTAETVQQNLHKLEAAKHEEKTAAQRQEMCNASSWWRKEPHPHAAYVPPQRRSMDVVRSAPTPLPLLPTVRRALTATRLWMMVQAWKSPTREAKKSAWVQMDTATEAEVISVKATVVAAMEDRRTSLELNADMMALVMVMKERSASSTAEENPFAPVSVSEEEAAVEQEEQEPAVGQTRSSTRR